MQNQKMVGVEMDKFKKRDFSKDERRVIMKFWERDERERKNILDVMTQFGCQVELLEDMAQKGILTRTSTRFFKLSQSTIEYLIDAECYNNSEW